MVTHIEPWTGVTNSISSKPTVWDGDANSERKYLLRSLAVLSPLGGMATQELRVLAVLGEFVPSPLGGMVTSLLSFSITM